MNKKDEKNAKYSYEIIAGALEKILAIGDDHKITPEQAKQVVACFKLLQSSGIEALNVYVNAQDQWLYATIATSVGSSFTTVGRGSNFVVRQADFFAELLDGEGEF